MIGGLNPWMSMWTEPRSTIRAILNINPRYGLFYLSSAYALQFCLFAATSLSLGLSFSFYAILLFSVILSPLFGMVWVYFAGCILYFTGRWLRGNASATYLRAAAAWSRIPSLILLFMWLVLLIIDSDMVFINAVSGMSSLFMNFISLIVWIWMFVLLVQAIREAQGFSLLRSIVNAGILWLTSFVLMTFIFSVIIYIYTIV